MASATWDTLFKGKTSLIRKMLFGSVLIKDYDATDSLATFTPFDPTTGGLSTTLLTGHNFRDMGYLDENGVKFAPTTAVADTLAWQSRLPLRTDFTSFTEKADCVFVETSPVVEAVFNNKPISTAPGLGSTSYAITMDLTPRLIYRSVVFIGVDGSGPDVQYAWKMYPKCLMTKPAEQDWQAKKEVQYGMEFTPYPDQVAGFAITQGRDGPGWRALTPANIVELVTITGAPTAGTFTLTFSGQTTAAIAYNATAAAVQSALVALPNIGTGNVSVTGAAGGPYSVTFMGTFAGTSVPLMTANATGLTGGTAPSVTVAYA